MRTDISNSKIFSKMMWFIALLLTVSMAGCDNDHGLRRPWLMGLVGGTVLGSTVPLAINLRSAASFGIAASAALTSTGITVVNGDVAVYPTATCTDATDLPDLWPPCSKLKASATGLTVNGSVYFAADPFDAGVTASAVKADLLLAFNEGMAKVDTLTVAGNALGGTTLTAGIYRNANLGLAAGTICRLDAAGDANAVFIFKVDVSMVDSGILGNPSRIQLINGAKARNVWFVVGVDVTIGAGSTWNGNILAGQSVSINQNSTVNGRVLGGATSLTGAISISSPTPSVTTITVPAN